MQIEKSAVKRLSALSAFLVLTLLASGCPEPEASSTDSNPEASSPETGSAEEAAGEGDSASAQAPSNRVLLGDPSLTAGIPGEGPLTLDEVQAYLADPRNHEVLEIELPMGVGGGNVNQQALEENPLTRAKIELGRQLYFDTRMSGDNTISCASCHDPDQGYTTFTAVSTGIADQLGTRNAPVSYNRIVSEAQFWDGRAASLEEQAKGPIENPIEHGMTHDDAVAAISAVEVYQLEFEKVFPEEGITIDTIAAAIAAFERTLVTGTALCDHYEIVRSFEEAYDEEDRQIIREEDPQLWQRYQDALAASAPMSDSARRGRELFFSDRVGCTACHAGANFTDELYHNIGVGMDSETPDVGRYEVTSNLEEYGAFKTPTLRNVALSAPYMHDGSQETLLEVVEWYAQDGHPNEHLDENISEVELTDQEKQDLVAFMESLTGEMPQVERGRLP